MTIVCGAAIECRQQIERKPAHLVVRAEARTEYQRLRFPLGQEFQDLLKRLPFCAG